jgi:hypothetical protein
MLMRLRQPRRRHVFVLGLLAFAIAAVAVAANSDAGPKTKKLHGKMINIANFPCASATGVCSRFESKGDIKGDGVVFIDTFPAGFPLATSDAHTVITTKKGELRCSERAIFDLQGADHAFVDLCLITGGTGIYAGATGYIQEVGTFDFASNLGELEYYGKITFADDAGEL